MTLKPWVSVIVIPVKLRQPRSMVIHLILTTRAGEEAQLIVDLQEYDSLREFEKCSAGTDS